MEEDWQGVIKESSNGGGGVIFFCFEVQGRASLDIRKEGRVRDVYVCADEGTEKRERRTKTRLPTKAKLFMTIRGRNNKDRKTTRQGREEISTSLLQYLG